MSNFLVSEPERTEEGGFVVKLTAEDGTLLAEGVGDSLEAAVEDAKSKL
jgi:hypothetical protein